MQADIEYRESDTFLKVLLSNIDGRNTSCSECWKRRDVCMGSFVFN